MTDAIHEAAVRIEPGELLSPAAQTLIAALNTELSRIYPEEGANHFRLDPDEVAAGRGAFLIAWRAAEPVGCGALRTVATGIGELKRMYVVPDARGQRIGHALLVALEQQARRLGLTRLVLETGARQDAAVALYRRAGFQTIDPFGEYEHSPLSLCLAKELADS
jgi:putative acetyltransferase